MNIKTDLSENIFLSERRWGKTLMQEQQWANLKCNDCGGKLELEKDNEFESVKVWLKAYIIKSVYFNLNFFCYNQTQPPPYI